jgi:hypothetical protein
MLSHETNVWFTSLCAWATVLPEVSILNRAQKNNNGARLNNHRLPATGNNCQQSGFVNHAPTGGVCRAEPTKWLTTWAALALFEGEKDTDHDP